MAGIKEETFNEWLLGCSKEHKQLLLRKAIKDRNVGAYFALTDILLKTPISKGGLATEDIPHPAEKFDYDEKVEE